MDKNSDKTILIVDDQPANLKLLTNILTQQGYHVRPAPSGALALRCVASKLPDIILLDINMPNMDGYEVCRQLKKNETTRDIPVIFISALAETTDILKAFSQGGVDYIVKPFKGEEVLARVNTHLSLREMQQQVESTLQLLQETQVQLIESGKMAALTGLVCGMAHEMNTPLGICLTAEGHIYNEINIIKKQLSSNNLTRKELTEFCESVSSSASLLFNNLKQNIDLIEKLKRISVDSGGLQEKFMLKNSIECGLLFLQPLLKNTKHTIQCHISESIILDNFPGAVEEITSLLVENALKHGFLHIDEGIIRIRAEINAQGLLLSYSDNGTGMPDEVQKKMYEPFFTTNRHLGCKGLGCSIVYNLVTEKLNGRIECQSEPGKGSIFTITIPEKMIVNFSNDNQ